MKKVNDLSELKSLLSNNNEVNKTNKLNTKERIRYYIDPLTNKFVTEKMYT